MSDTAYKLVEAARRLLDMDVSYNRGPAVVNAVEDLEAALAAHEAETKAAPALFKEQSDYADGYNAGFAAGQTAAPVNPSPTTAPLTEDVLLDAFCNTPHTRHFSEAFIAGARFAERIHNIGDNK